MSGNMEGTIEYTGPTLDEIEFEKKLEGQKAKEIRLIAKLALCGHPVTHIEGVPLAEVIALAERYSNG